MPVILLVLLSVLELTLLGAVFLFFLRLRRSEELLQELQARHDDFLAKLHLNAELEEELVSSFAQRQNELAALNSRLDERVRELKDLMHQAESLAKSPGVLRRMILDGHRQGRTTRELAQATGLSLDEVELILTETKA